jgi:hypothetical protein
VKVYAIYPNLEVFDGTGSLDARAKRVIGIIVEVVVDSLRDGGDSSHHAAIWEGPVETGSPPSLNELADRKGLVALTMRLRSSTGPSRVGVNIFGHLGCLPFCSPVM